MLMSTKTAHYDFHMIKHDESSAVEGLKSQRSLSPVDLPVFVEVLQPLQDLLQDGCDAGLVQHSSLVLAARNDMLDDVQNRAWETGRHSISM